MKFLRNLFRKKKEVKGGLESVVHLISPLPDGERLSNIITLDGGLTLGLPSPNHLITEWLEHPDAEVALILRHSNYPERQHHAQEKI